LCARAIAQAAQKKRDADKSAKECKEAREVVRVKYFDLLNQLQERAAAKNTKDTQALEKIVATKVKAVLKEQKQFDEDCAALSQEIARTFKTTQAGQVH
jgi:hypothetical protein